MKLSISSMMMKVILRQFVLLSFAPSYWLEWHFTNKVSSTTVICIPFMLEAVRLFCGSDLVPSGPDLSGHHGFFGAHGGHEILLTEEVQRELDEEAPNLLQKLLSFDRLLFIKTWFGLETQELLFVPHQTGGQTAENLQCHHIKSPQSFCCSHCIWRCGTDDKFFQWCYC